MSNDLVKRLRAGVNLYYGTGPCGLLNEAADRIYALEKALEKVAQHDLQAIALDALRPGERSAIGEKKDDR